MLRLEIDRCNSRAVQRFWFLLFQTISLTYLLFFIGEIQAGQLREPEGEVLLTITGNVGITNSEIIVDGETIPAASFDIDMLKSLPVEKFTTKNPWTEGDTEFEGVRFDVLLESVDADLSNVSLYALDEYAVDIVNGEFADYPIVVAYKRDGNYMSVRDLGPLWLMYPFDDFPHLDTSQTRAHCVWQLIRIEVN